MNTRFARWWVAAFVAALLVFGVGQLEAWPFTSWYMFSHIEPNPTRIARAYAIGPDGAEHLLGPDVLPAGLLSHRLLAEVRGGAQRSCETILPASRAIGVRIVEESWDALERSGDGHAPGTIVERARCGSA